MYVVAGSSGKISSGPLDHPIMVASLKELGSVVLDVNGLRLDARFINNRGVVRDSFTVMKDDATAVLLARFDLGAVEDGIEIRWELGRDAAFAGITVERAGSSDGPWQGIGAEELATPGLRTVVDSAVEAGRTYHYRLRGSRHGGADMIFGPLSIIAGRPAAPFAFVAVTPNPSRGKTHIDYSVARESQVRLSIIDVQGREIAELVRAFHRPGRYQAVWTGETDSGLAPTGLYFVHGRAGAKSIVERLILAR